MTFAKILIVPCASQHFDVGMQGKAGVCTAVCIYLVCIERRELSGTWYKGNGVWSTEHQATQLRNIVPPEVT